RSSTRPRSSSHSASRSSPAGRSAGSPVTSAASIRETRYSRGSPPPAPTRYHVPALATRPYGSRTRSAASRAPGRPYPSPRPPVPDPEPAVAPDRLLHRGQVGQVVARPHPAARVHDHPVRRPLGPRPVWLGQDGEQLAQRGAQLALQTEVGERAPAGEHEQ